MTLDLTAQENELFAQNRLYFKKVDLELTETSWLFRGRILESLLEHLPSQF